METRFLDNWTTQLRKGILELCVLNAMKGVRLYGYDIVKRLSGIEGLVIAEGTIYPILSRLAREGLVNAEWAESHQGPPRKYYALTPNGKKAYRILQKEFTLLHELVTRAASAPEETVGGEAGTQIDMKKERDNDA